MTTEWGLPQDVVLLDGDGHTWIALDYRTDPHAVEPAVVSQRLTGTCQSAIVWVWSVGAAVA